VDITKDEFDAKMKSFSNNLESMFSESKELEEEIKKQLAGLNYG
jgi:type I restriction enzyme M protein